jgi:hypothetical protein
VVRRRICLYDIAIFGVLHWVYWVASKNNIGNWVGKWRLGFTIYLLFPFCQTHS